MDEESTLFMGWSIKGGIIAGGDGAALGAAIAADIGMRDIKFRKLSMID